MNLSRLHCLLIVGVFLIVGCKHKKANLAGNAPVKVNDFIAAFAPLPLPFSIADTNIGSSADTTLIGAKVIEQFIPDSILSQVVNIKTKFTIHPSGRFEKENENYLLATIAQKKKVQLLVMVFDKKNKFLAAKSLLANDEVDGYSHSLYINKEPTFLISKERISPQTKQLQFSRSGWVYNSAGLFMVVVNDNNEDPKKTDNILNPLDTLPKKNKLSGEYNRDKKNFITIRDGKDANTYLFFIHFEKKEGSCVGELKGILQMQNPTTGIYNQSGDPCVIDFIFNGNDVTLKEKGSCGNRRGMECFFDDHFTKKKEVIKPVKNAKPKK